MSLWCEYRQANSIDKSIGGGKEGCQTLHMTKFEVRFEFLAEKIGLCDSKHALSCQTCEKIPKIVNIYSKVPKFSRQTRLIAKLNSWKEIWISRLEAPPTPYVGNCRCTPLDFDGPYWLTFPHRSTRHGKGLFWLNWIGGRKAERVVRDAA